MLPANKRQILHVCVLTPRRIRVRIRIRLLDRRTRGAKDAPPLEDFSGQPSSRLQATRISAQVNDDKLIKPEMSAPLNLIIKVYVFHSNFPFPFPSHSE